MLMYERTSKDRKKRKKELYYDTLVAMDRAYFHHFGTMTHTPGIGNFSV